MQVQFGTVCPDGFLPVFSVDTEEEAQSLLVACCQRGHDGEFYATETLPFAGSEADQEERLEAFYAFGERLRLVYEKIKARKR